MGSLLGGDGQHRDSGLDNGVPLHPSAQGNELGPERPPPIPLGSSGAHCLTQEGGSWTWPRGSKTHLSDLGQAWSHWGTVPSSVKWV